MQCFTARFRFQKQKMDHLAILLFSIFFKSAIRSFTTRDQNKSTLTNISTSPIRHKCWQWSSTRIYIHYSVYSSFEIVALSADVTNLLSNCPRMYIYIHIYLESSSIILSSPHTPQALGLKFVRIPFTSTYTYIRVCTLNAYWPTPTQLYLIALLTATESYDSWRTSEFTTQTPSSLRLNFPLCCV